MAFFLDDLVVLKKPFWYKGQDLGGRLGVVVNTYSYIYVDLLSFDDNPIKCFASELELLDSNDLTLDDEEKKEDE